MHFKTALPSKRLKTKTESAEIMLSIIAAILAVIWAIGTATSHTLDGFLHVLVIFAVALPFIQLIRSRSQRHSKTDHESRIHINETAAS